MARVDKNIHKEYDLAKRVMVSTIFDTAIVATMMGAHWVLKEISIRIGVDNEQSVSWINGISQIYFIIIFLILITINIIRLFIGYPIDRGSRPTGMNTAIVDVLADKNTPLADKNTPMPIDDLAETIGVSRSVVQTRVEALDKARVVDFNRANRTVALNPNKAEELRS